MNTYVIVYDDQVAILEPDRARHVKTHLVTLAEIVEFCEAYGVPDATVRDLRTMETD